MPYRAPELFNVESYCMIDERTDIWVNSDSIISNEISVLITVHKPRQNSCGGGWLLWCGAGGMFTTRWARGAAISAKYDMSEITLLHMD
jgi:hypothetical protein